MQRTIYSLLIAVVLLAGQPAGASVPEGGGVPCDFVTGGGFIIRMETGAKANFGVGGGVKNGAFWGHLEYNDHSTSPPLQVHGTGVTGYFLAATNPSEPNERIITGTARVNGVDGYTYKVEVIDNGEPGGGVDAFSIVLIGPGAPDVVYAAGTEYGDGPIAGGNIQLHKGNPSNTPPEGTKCPQ